MAKAGMSYIARRDCGCVVGAVVDREEIRGEVSWTVGEWMNEDLSVEHVTTALARKLLVSGGHGCWHDEDDDD